MKLPKTVEVLNRTYKVIEDDLSESSFIGVSRSMKGEIKIEKTLHNQAKAETLLHEIIHSIYHSMGWEVGDETKDNPHTERNVLIITNGLCAVMRDNPDIFKDIIDNLERDDLEEEEVEGC